MAVPVWPLGRVHRPQGIAVVVGVGEVVRRDREVRAAEAPAAVLETDIELQAVEVVRRSPMARMHEELRIIGELHIEAVVQDREEEVVVGFEPLPHVDEPNTERATVAGVARRGLTAHRREPNAERRCPIGTPERLQSLPTSARRRRRRP